MSELKRGEINDERDNHLHSTRIQHAIQKLERSDRVQSSDFTASCSQLLQLNFHSEEGRFYVIDKLTQFNGNFVAKIIRKGLSSLNKVYTEPKAFEDESIALVDLCFSLYSKQQDRKEDGQCSPSPKQEEEHKENGCSPSPKQQEDHIEDGQCSASPKQQEEDHTEDGQCPPSPKHLEDGQCSPKLLEEDHIEDGQCPPSPKLQEEDHIEDGQCSPSPKHLEDGQCSASPMHLEDGQCSPSPKHLEDGQCSPSPKHLEDGQCSASPKVQEEDHIEDGQCPPSPKLLEDDHIEDGQCSPSPKHLEEGQCSPSPKILEDHIEDGQCPPSPKLLEDDHIEDGQCPPSPKQQEEDHIEDGQCPPSPKLLEEDHTEDGQCPPSPKLLEDDHIEDGQCPPSPKLLEDDHIEDGQCPPSPKLLEEDHIEDGQCSPSPKQEEDGPCSPIPKQLDDGQCSPSPALLVDCTADLCEELLKSAKCDGTSSLHVEIKLSKCLEELVNLYQIMFRYMLAPFSGLSDYAPSKLLNFFQETFASLKQRANDERFDDLINKTAIVAKCDQKINLKGTFIRHEDSLLKYWNKLLMTSFVSNSFAIEIVQHDIVVNGNHESKSDDYQLQIYKESLIYSVSSLKDTDIGCELCNVDKERQDILFNHDFLFSHYTGLCLELIQSDIPTTCLEMLFGIFSSNNENSPPNVEEDVKIYNSITLLLSPLFSFRHGISLPKGRRHQSLMFEVAAQATLRQKGNYAAIEEIIKFWRNNFPRKESSYVILTKILDFTILEPGKIPKERSELTRYYIDSQRKQTMKPHHCENVLKNLVGFLSQLPADTLCSTTDWLSLYFSLVLAFPESWNCQESLEFIKFFSNLEAHGFGEVKEDLMNIIKDCFEFMSNSQPQVNNTAVLQIMVQRLREDSNIERYKLALNILTCIAPYIQVDKIVEYLSDCLTIVSFDVWSDIFVLITASSAEDKEEIFMCLLKAIKNATDIKAIGELCIEFCLVSVNISNVKEFYRRLKNPCNWEMCRLIVECCWAWCGDKGFIPYGERFKNLSLQSKMSEIRKNASYVKNFGDLVLVLFSAVDGCLHSSRFALFSHVICDYLSRASSMKCSAENCHVLVECVAESIYDDTFDKLVHDQAIVLTCQALALRKNESEITPNDVSTFYRELIFQQKTFKQYGINWFSGTLSEILTIPLRLKDITLLIQDVAACVAESISVCTFNKSEHDQAIKLICKVPAFRKNECEITSKEVLIFYKELTKIFRQTSFGFYTISSFYNTLEETLKFPLALKDTIRLIHLFVECVAESISVGTFNESKHTKAIKLTSRALELRKNECHEITAMDVFTFYNEVIKIVNERTTRQYGLFGGHKMEDNLEEMLKIPLTFKDVILLVSCIGELFQRGNITNDQDAQHILFYLFKLTERTKQTKQSGTSFAYGSISQLVKQEEGTVETIDPFSNIPSCSLMEHFVSVMTMSVAQVQKLSRVPICTSDSKELTSMLQVLVKKTPMSFIQNKSSKLHMLLIDKIDESNAEFFMDLVDVTIEEDVSPEEFEESLHKVEDMIRSMTSPLNPGLKQLITSCVTEYYKIGMEKEWKIMTLLLSLSYWQWTREDLEMVTSQRSYFRNIPKQLVQAFQTTSCPEEMRGKIKRAIEMAHHLKGLKGLEHLPIDAAQREFQMFLNDSNLDINHLSTTLLVCEEVCKSSYAVSTHFFDKQRSSEGIQEKQNSLGKLICCVTDHLKRLEVAEGDLKKTTMNMINSVLKNIEAFRDDCRCYWRHSQNTTEDFISSFTDVVQNSVFIEEVQHWLDLEPIHAVLCKDVIVTACTWKNGKKSREEALNLNENIQKTLNDITGEFPHYPHYEHLKADVMDVMVEIIRTTEDLCLMNKLFQKLTDYRKRRIPLDFLKSINGWSNSIEIFKFLSKIEELTAPDIGTYMLSHAIPVLPFICTAFPNSADKVVQQFQRVVAKREEGDYDPLGLQRIIEWSKTMITTGFSKSVIESWCTSLVLYENLTSRDVDSIANLTPSIIQLISKEPGEIGKCLFETTAPKSWHDKRDLKSFKRSLQFAKILNEFASVAKIFQANALLLEKIKDGTHDLCSTFLQNQTSPGQMYKVRFNFFKEMFVLVFTIVGVNEESMPNLTSQKGLSSGFVTVFRRLARHVQDTPVLFDHLISIVNCTLQYIDQYSKPDYQAIQNVIHKHVMALEANQDAIHTLQAAGYNQGTSSEDQCTLSEDQCTSSEDQCTSSEDQGTSSEDQGTSSEDQGTSSEDQGTSSEDQCTSSDDQSTPRKDQDNSSEDQGTPDLWFCTSIQLSSYVPSVDSLLKFRIQRLLRQTWREWRHILSELKIEEIDFNGVWIKTNELMNYSDSLDTMELQLEAVKKATGSAPPQCWSSDRRRQLMEKEKYVRASFEKESKSETKKSTLTKMVISWDNQLLDAVKTCSEKIPGCYAPDGFLSRKPVICGLAVDNRILTLYKQEKGKTLTELENVEVKLYPVGMLVFGNHSSGHCYDTDQLWAAFFKMLLLKRLVPKIFLSNISPGFEWIKRFVSPEDPTSPPGRMATFRSCNTLIPTNEDGYDYEPNVALRYFYSSSPSEPYDPMAELIILTPQTVKMMEFPSLKSPKRDELIRALMKKIPQAVQNNQQLLEIHPRPDIREKLVKRLTGAIRQAVEISVDKQVPQPVETVLEKVSKCIDLKKLSSGFEEEDATKVKENGEDIYIQIILDALRTEMDGHAEYNKEYDCCEHVQFLQSNEFTPDRDE